MADAKRCDRCKEYYTPNKDHKPFGISMLCEDGKYRKKDLCHNCMEELSNWFKGGEQK